MSHSTGISRGEALEVCAGLPATTEERPFGPETSVFKVVGKVFALTDLESEPATLTLKAAPPHAEALVREHPWIIPGYHMNKKHWVTLTLGPGSDAALVADLIVNSYDLVVAGLPRAKRP
ncbi:MmcQ/YjbR family DNA-binding protein [Herbiconiux sp. YIM B11900]|uniref:MmcQ/YjbR family DNA-binding protein n=1 Tax=Herbiconiux sp. YIM B11900 TaxID=3404131 RepID=UPI003F829218